MLYQYSPYLLDDPANRKVDLYARAKYDILLGWIYDFNITDYLYYFFPQLQNHVEDRGQCFGKFDGTRNAIIVVDEDACGQQLRDIRMAHEGLHDLPVAHRLNGYVYVPEVQPQGR